MLTNRRSNQDVFNLRKYAVAQTWRAVDNAIIYITVSSVGGLMRVVITGFGVVSSIGSGRAQFLSGLQTGRCGAAPISQWNTAGFPQALACEVTDFDPLHILRGEIDHGEVSALAAAAATMAMADADYDLEQARTESGLIALGTTCGESRLLDGFAAAELKNPQAPLPQRISSGCLATAVAAELRLEQVEAVTVPTVCAAGNYALGFGLDSIRCGAVDFALCGGADAVNRMAVSGFFRMGSLAEERCRPFDRHRDGLMWGEGAAVLVVESEVHARQRGAHILAEVLGFHMNCDASHPTAPLLERVSQVVAGAVRESGLKPQDLDAIFAHATGTALNDPMEVAALRAALGPTLPAVVGLKSLIGHTMGAAATHAAIAAILSMQHSFLPPTGNLRELDTQCLIDCVPNTSRPADVRTALVNSLGLGGNNAAVVLQRFDE
jgi:3-oxoacyl-[acyl-carrier-protein] synthase II